MHVLAGGLTAFAAQRFGERVALTTRSGNLTFAELLDTAHRFGSGLRSIGLQPGDRVGVLSHNRSEVVQAWLGLEAHGLVRVVLHTHFDMAIHAQLLASVRAAAPVFDTRFSDQVDKCRDDLAGVRLIAIGEQTPAWAT